MVRVSDYIGLSFGDFEIKENISHGAEAEIYTCLHKSTGRLYILKLCINDDYLWSDQPVIPPINFICEYPDDKQMLYAQLSAQRTYEYSLKNRLQGNDTMIYEVDRYGVLDNRYLVPIDAVVTTKHSWDVDRLLKEAPANDLFLFELWEEIALSMMSEAYLVNKNSISEDEWIQKWGNLTGGEILKLAVTQYLDNGQLSRKEKEMVIARVSERHTAGPELAENLLLRMAGAFSRRRMSADEVMGTLLCRQFRINVTAHELTQFVDILNNLQSELSNRSLKLLTFISKPLSQQPLDIFKNYEFFNCRVKETEYGEYKTILQEYAGFHQDCLSLVIGESKHA